MEAGTEFRGAEISKSLIVVAALSIMLALAVLTGVMTKNLGQAPAAPRAHIAATSSAAHTAAAADDMPGARGMRIGAHI